MMLMTKRSRSLSGLVGIYASAAALCLGACTVKPADDDDDDDNNAGESGAGGSGGSSGGSDAGTGGTATGGSGATGGTTSGSGNQAGSGGTNAAGTNNAGGSGGSAGEPSDDNCPEDDSPDQTDTDGDGRGDVCDQDDDDDGFVDVDDPEPLDVDVPGDFSTPEKILADSRVRAALQGLLDAGYTLPTHEDSDPPDISGYHVTDGNDGEFVANSSESGTGVGNAVVDQEDRLEIDEDGKVNVFRISLSGGSPTSFGISRAQLLRGTGNEFTLYTFGRSVCTESDSNYTTWSLGITSGTLDDAGNWLDVLGMRVTVATVGELTTACADRQNGTTELEGEWTAWTLPLVEKVEASELEAMCVDGDAAYVPTETWTGADGGDCSCTDEYSVECTET